MAASDDSDGVGNTVPSRTPWPACIDIGVSAFGASGTEVLALPAEVQVRGDFLADDPDQVDPQENAIKTMLMMAQVQSVFQ